jgi:predicted AlkP superfamily pyrophosphatase or phosphodiesterase
MAPVDRLDRARRAGALPTSGKSFADIPVRVQELLQDGHRSVGVVLLDAFGRRFLERYADHPFLRRLAVTELRTQFPSTTTAHVTTMHTGLPVGEHGLYEWNVYEPALDAIVTPLLFSFAGDGERDTLRGHLDPATFIDGQTLYQRLGAAGVRSTVMQPARFSPSTFDRVSTAGARLAPFSTLRGGVAAFFDALAEPGYVYLYWDGIDAVGHAHGPRSTEFDLMARRTLDAFEHGVRSLPGGAVLMVTADHGQVEVDPARVLFLDELWPELPGLLTHRPAGSARDVFLHTRDADAVIAGLRERLGERADVRRADELVARGPRLADVCVLPAPGLMAWLRSAADAAMRFRGHHGGLHPDETETWVGTLYS